MSTAQQLFIDIVKEANRPLGVKLKTSKTLPTKCRVVEVFPDSPAQQFGILVDDVIIKLNEQETRLLTKEGVLELLKICASKTDVAVTVVRSDPAVKTSQVTQEDKDRKKAEPNEPKQALPSATPQRPAGVTNYINGRKMTDTLILKANKNNPTGCTEKRCLGSQMFPKRRNLKEPYTKEEMKELAKDFYKQFYQSIKSENSSEHLQREAEVLKDIEEKGTYHLTFKELSFGCRTAWRNAPRCMNRIQWRKLVVFDQRDVKTAEEMYAAMVRHVRFCSNPEKPGIIRSAITVFPVTTDKEHEYRVWNSLFIRYAGYKMEDGSILGDPASVDFTSVCLELGWQPPKERTPFDVLPLVLQANGGDPELFDLDQKDVLEVHLTHPKYPEFDKLNLKWYAVPGVSNLLLEIGGLRFTAAPFSGWYLVTEIGARDLGDPQRYNMLEKMAQIMKLDTKTDQMWKDKAMVELNAAVLHSYNSKGVTLLDHHSGSESFMKFMEQEYTERGGCPADWVWIVPPMTGSATPVFHQEMLLYHLTPCFEYQEDPWIKWRQSRQPGSGTQVSMKERFKRVVRFTARLAKIMQDQMKKRRQCTILYATETGRSESYAKMLLKLFGHAFKCDLYCMESYDFDKLSHEELVLIVSSTFGSGEPPSNGEDFAKKLVNMRAPQYPTHGRISVVLTSSSKAKQKDTTEPLSAIKFAVFGLGSRAYPDTFCAFAHTVDKLFEELGAERLYNIGEGDELCGQEEAFRDWAIRCYDASCKYYNLDPNLQHDSSLQSLLEVHKWGKNKFRIRKITDTTTRDKVESLKQFHNRPNIIKMVLKDRQELQSPNSSRSTIKIVLTYSQVGLPIFFEPGDHLSIFPENSPSLVSQLLERLDLSDIGPDDPIQLEYNKGSGSGDDEWIEEKRFPHVMTLREILTRYLDITTPPSPQLLGILATQAKQQDDRIDIESLAKGEEEYEEWKYNFYPNLVEVIDWFCSLHGQVDPSMLLSQLPVLQSRYYSISSSPNYHPGEVHLTVAVVAYQVKPIPGLEVKFKNLHPTFEGPIHFGVCSNWLHKIKIGSTIPAFTRRAAAFHLPRDPRVPVIMVGPGTGIAPFRSFWQERMYQVETTRNSRMRYSKSAPVHKALSRLKKPDLPRSSSDQARPKSRRITVQTRQPADSDLQNGDEGIPLVSRHRSASDSCDHGQIIHEMLKASSEFGSMYLFFGCRQSTLDHIYKDEMAKACMFGAVEKCYVALSREPNQSKMYVQDKLKEEADTVVQLLIARGAHFYVCGDISMANDVSHTLHSILTHNAAMTDQEARSFVTGMKENGTYHEDIFGVTLRTAEVTDRFRTAARRNWQVQLSKTSVTIGEECSGEGAQTSSGPAVTLLARHDVPTQISYSLEDKTLPSGRKISQHSHSGRLVY